ncbi:hypothetical protein FGO68_gene4187 [Halteria grandinella]|uniref:Uncharacterized protein n=1 Tax=Halteria grandinella TaxID=5974 RepID=A0A8J8T4J3_HALGN|nr:hypothetical protein FGO68_gene4187 [Halteria grandinella]
MGCTQLKERQSKASIIKMVVLDHPAPKKIQVEKTHALGKLMSKYLIANIFGYAFGLRRCLKFHHKCSKFFRKTLLQQLAILRQFVSSDESHYVSEPKDLCNKLQWDKFKGKKLVLNCSKLYPKSQIKKVWKKELNIDAISFDQGYSDFLEVKSLFIGLKNPRKLIIEIEFGYRKMLEDIGRMVLGQERVEIRIDAGKFNPLNPDRVGYIIKIDQTVVRTINFSEISKKKDAAWIDRIQQMAIACNQKLKVVMQIHHLDSEKFKSFEDLKVENKALQFETISYYGEKHYYFDSDEEGNEQVDPIDEIVQFFETANKYANYKSKQKAMAFVDNEPQLMILSQRIKIPF